MSVTESDEAARDRELASELEILRKEREDIISGVALETSPELARVKESLGKRLDVALCAREYQLANLQKHFDLEKKKAWDEFCNGKARLREQIILTHVDRRKRLDAFKLTGSVSKRRKRVRPLPSTASKESISPPAPASPGLSPDVGSSPGRRSHLASSLESQGLIRVALGPDEINRDLAIILRRLDTARANSVPQVASTPRAEGVSSGVMGAQKSDSIHSSRGILHFHNEVFEKGDNVVAYLPDKPHPPKFAGVILSVNSKEIQVKSHRSGPDGKPETNRVYVSHLRKDSIRIKHV